MRRGSAGDGRPTLWFTSNAMQILRLSMAISCARKETGSSITSSLLPHKLGGIDQRLELTQLTCRNRHRLRGKLDKRRRIRTRISVHPLEKHDWIIRYISLWTQDISYNILQFVDFSSSSLFKQIDSSDGSRHRRFCLERKLYQFILDRIYLGTLRLRSGLILLVL